MDISDHATTPTDVDRPRGDERCNVTKPSLTKFWRYIILANGSFIIQNIPLAHALCLSIDNGLTTEVPQQNVHYETAYIDTSTNSHIFLHHSSKHSTLFLRVL